MSKPHFLSENGLLYFWSQLKSLLGDKVDKETGKGLSTNDYSTTEKEKLNNIASGAQVNTIESIKVNGTTQAIDAKVVDITMPTALSDLTNDGDFVSDASYVHTDNNYTTAEKTKLSGVETGAEVNIIESVSVNGTAQTVSNKGINIAVPTSTSDLTNDSNYVSDASYVHTDNNYTTTEKTKLSGIETGAEVNAISSIKVNGTAQTITNKAVDISVPTATSDLTNDTNFVSDASYVHTDNNYTTTEKTKLSNIESGAEVNIIETISVNGTQQTITSKGVNISVPTNTNQLTNGAGFQTSSDVQTAISTALANITGFSFEVVQALPASGEVGVIYLVAHSHDTDDGYDEYIWVNNAFEKLGHADVDLSGFVETTDVITNNEIDTILAT